LIKTSTGFISSLNEALADPQIANYLKDSKAIKEVKALKKFENRLKTNFERIAYGDKDVFYAAKSNAIDTLLISDKLFRTKDLNKRKIYNRLVDDVQRKGGEIFIFSSLHQSGERLNNYSGVAAILRFEMQL
jgi:protein pelota